MKTLTTTDKLFLALVAAPVAVLIVYFAFKFLTDFHHFANL